MEYKVKKNLKVQLSNKTSFSLTTCSTDVVIRSCPKVFCKQAVLKNITQFTGKCLYQTVKSSKRGSATDAFINVFLQIKFFLQSVCKRLLLCIVLTARINQKQRHLKSKYQQEGFVQNVSVLLFSICFFSFDVLIRLNVFCWSVIPKIPPTIYHHHHHHHNHHIKFLFKNTF